MCVHSDTVWPNIKVSTGSKTFLVRAGISNTLPVPIILGRDISEVLSLIIMMNPALHPKIQRTPSSSLLVLRRSSSKRLLYESFVDLDDSSQNRQKKLTHPLEVAVADLQSADPTLETARKVSSGEPVLAGNKCSGILNSPPGNKGKFDTWEQLVLPTQCRQEDMLKKGETPNCRKLTTQTRQLCRRRKKEECEDMASQGIT